MNFIIALFTKFGAKIWAVLAGIAGIAGLYLAGKSSGKKDAAVEAANQRVKDNEQSALKEIAAEKDAAHKRIDAAQSAKQVSSANAKLSDADIAKRLRDEYTRD